MSLSRVRVFLKNESHFTIARKDHGENGDTLIEVLVALLVLSVCALALIIAFSTSISASAEHRDLATAHIVLASYSQQAIAQIEQNKDLFGCGAQNQSNETTYVLSSIQNQITIPQNYGSYTATVTNVQYWNSATGAFQSACIQNENPPLEVTVQVQGPGGPFTNTFVVNLPSGDLGSVNDLSNGTISQLEFTSLPGSGASGTSGVPFSPQPVVSALDSNNEVVVSSFPSLQLTIESGPSPATISGYSQTPTDGIVSFSGATITGPAGTYVVQATWNGINSDPSGSGLNENSYNPLGSSFWQSSPNWYTTTFTVVVAGASDKVVFHTAPQAAASGATLTTQPTIWVEAGTQPDHNQNGSVTLNLTGGSLTGCKANGVAVPTSQNGETLTVPIVAGAMSLTNCQFSGAIFYNATASPAGPDPTTYTIVATYPSATSASTQISVTGPGAVNSLVFVQQPSGVSNVTNSAAPWPQPFAVEVEDAYGNPVWTVNATQVSAVFDSTDAVADTLSHCSETSVTDSATATFSGCEGVANRFGGGLKIKASYGSNPNVITADSQPFSISSDAKSLVFTTQPAAGQSGSALANQPVIEILDGLGNVDTGWSGAINLTSSGGTLTGCTGQTPNNGFATISTCLFAGNPGTSYTLTASLTNAEGQVITQVSAPFSPSQAGTATQLQFTTQPVAGSVAGSVMATQPVVKIEDSQGNVVTSSTASITLTSSGGTLAGCANLTAVLGVVNVSNCTFGGLIGSQYTLTAKSPGLLQTVSAPFGSNTVAGTEAGVLISAIPNSVPASNVSDAQLNIQVVDNWGNPTVSNGETVLTVSSSSTGGFFTATNGQAGTPGTSSTVTIPSGAPTATVYYGDETAGAPTITAFDSGTIRAFGSASLTITAGPATKLIYTIPPTTPITAGTTFSIGVTEEDQFNNVASSDNTSVVALAASNGTSSGGFTCATNSGVVTIGVVTFSSCYFTSASPSAYVVTASETGLTSVTASVTVTAGPASQVVVWSGNNQSTKVNTAFANPLMVLVTDASGNPVSGATVTFTSSVNGATGKFAAAGTVCGAGTGKNSCTAVTNAAGIATSSTFTASATAGTYNNVTAGTPGATSATFTETNTTASATPTLQILTSVQNFSTTTTSSGTTSGSVVIQAQDGNGNPITLTSPLTVNLTYTTTGTLTLPTNPSSVTIPAGSSDVAVTVTATSAAGAPTIKINASATGYVATSQTESVRANATPTATLSLPSPGAVAAGSNAVFPVSITNSTNGTLYYSVVAVNGLLPDETTASTGCLSIGRGAKGTISETISTSDNRPSGAYPLSFIVESFNSNHPNCGGTTSFFQVNGTLTISSTPGSFAIAGGYGQMATHGTNFTTPLSVIVTDGNGNAVSGAVVTFTAPAGGASGTFLALTNGGACVASGTAGAVAVSSCTATTSALGVASTATFTANAIPGAYSVQASTTGQANVSFEEENQ